MNSPRFPPVDRSLSSDSKNNIYNQLRPHHIDDRNYYESQSISRASASKQILPPLESSGRKQTKSIASKNGKITMMIIIAMCFIFKNTMFYPNPDINWFIIDHNYLLRAAWPGFGTPRYPGRAPRRASATCAANRPSCRYPCALWFCLMYSQRKKIVDHCGPPLDPYQDIILVPLNPWKKFRVR